MTQLQKDYKTNTLEQLSVKYNKTTHEIVSELHSQIVKKGKR